MSSQSLIATSVCVDTEHWHSSIQYPMMETGSGRGKACVYWSVAIAFLATSLRWNPAADHVVYSNVKNPGRINGQSIRKLLRELGVTLRHLPFSRFCPPEDRCQKFRNAFYKLDVLNHLARSATGPSLLVDSDCIALAPLDDYWHQLPRDHLALYDVYAREDVDQDTPHGLSRRAMGNTFRTIDPDYPCATPVWFGGEFVAGHPSALRRAASMLEESMEKFVLSSRDAPIQFPNGSGIFDNDEFLSSFAYNHGGIPLFEASHWLRRLASSDLGTRERVGPEISEPLLHLPGEKSQRLRHLYHEAIDKDSEFWSGTLSHFRSYLNDYLGTPMQRRGLSEPRDIQTPTPPILLFLERIVRRVKNSA